jgi:uncharacterized protein YndB with AHSA1/START domain
VTKELTEIRKTILIDARPETVFSAITDEKELTKWFPDQARMEPRVGGAVQFKFLEGGKENHSVEGRVLEIVPGRKISYSWTNTSDPNFPKTVVTWTLEPAGDDKTRVTLLHTGFDPKSKWSDMHDKGWSYFIDRLAKHCAGRTVGERAKLR